MLIYFDESYDYEHKYLLLSILLNPHPKFFQRRLAEVKKQFKYLSQDGKLREIKYNYVTNKTKLEIARAAIGERCHCQQEKPLMIWEGKPFFRKTMKTSANFPDTPPEPNPVNCMEPW